MSPLLLCALLAAAPAKADASAPAPKPLAPVPVPARPLPVVPPMTVVSLPDATRPIVSLRLVFRTGSVDDPAGKEGLTALTTRLLTEGGTRKLSSSQLLEALFPMAAELTATTDKELTVIAGRVHKDRLERFLEIFSDVLLDPRLEAKELDRLKAEQLSALTNRLRGENDEELGKAGLDSLLYAGHPYRHPAVGTEAGLKAITLEDAKAHWQKVFTQDRLILGLAGAVDEALVKRVKQRFEKLPATGQVRAPLPNAPGVRGATLILQRDTLSTAGSFGFTWPMRRDDPDFFAVMMAMSYLGEHRQEHGVLFDELRDKRGLNYGTYAYAEHFLQDGWTSIPRPNVARSIQDTTIWLRPVEAKNGVFATRAVLRFTNAVLKEPIPADRFATARGFLIGATRIWTQTDQRRLGWAIDEVIYGTPGFADSLRTALQSMTAEQMQAAFKKHFTPESLNFVFVTKDAEGLRKALLSKAPSPIVYPTPVPKAVLDADKVIESWPLPMQAGAITVIDAATFMRQ